MAIRKHINVGDVLWKEQEEHSYMRYDRARGTSFEQVQVRYYQYSLHSRRARTNGANISRKLVPFFTALNIRVLEYPNHGALAGDEPMIYVAVGVRKLNIYSPEAYENCVLCAPALAYYNKIKNHKLTPLLDTRRAPYSEEIIVEMKVLLNKDETESELVEEIAGDWPEPPPFQEYSLEPSTGAYRRRYGR